MNARIELLTRGLEDSSLASAYETIDQIIRRRLVKARAEVERGEDCIESPDELESAHALLVQISEIIGESIEDLDAEES